MTAKDVSGASTPAWVSTAAVLGSAVAGIAAAACVCELGGIELMSAMASQASGYCEIFSHTRTLNESFSCAVMLSRADIAWMFTSQLFPLLAAVPSRVLTAACAVLRAFLTAMAIAAAVTVSASLTVITASVVSLVIGAVAVWFVLHGAFVLGGREVSLRGSIWGIASACAWSGGIILCRSAILFIAGL